MGGLFGDFTPTEAYFAHVQKSVWAANNASSPVEIWDSLHLNVRLENGYFLFPAGGYTIDDSPDFSGEPKRIEIAGVSSHVLDDFFLKNPPRPFVSAPWEEIGIGQKIGFEEELKKELGLSRASLFDYLKSRKDAHVLADFECSALCKCGANDDVLFAVRKNGDDNQFAVVHLTWRRKMEIPGYPGTEFYRDFDAFLAMTVEDDY